LPSSWTIASPRSTDLGTSKEVRGFVENVNRISATEVLEHERINKDGVVIEQKHHKFNYVAEIQETRPGILNMGEYRDGSPGQSGFPGEPEHQVLDYGRVQFEHEKRKLWPPQEAIYLDVNGKSFHHGHTYSDYRVFSVD
jgi:hypothetical protein